MGLPAPKVEEPRDKQRQKTLEEWEEDHELTQASVRSSDTKKTRRIHQARSPCHMRAPPKHKIFSSDSTKTPPVAKVFKKHLLGLYRQKLFEIPRTWIPLSVPN